MNFGTQTSEKDSYAIMDRALELGINFWDTANVYGGRKGEGITEQVLGRYFAQGGGRREKVVLATKVYGDMGDWPNTSRLSALHIRRACEESLRRMQTDYIDLYQMHHVWREAPWEEIWQAMELLVAQGKVIYTGSSNFAGWHIVQANEAAKRRNFLGLVSEQCHYNLFTRTVERDLLPACESYGVGVIPWSPLGGGMLAGVLDRPTVGRRADSVKHMEEHRSKLEPWEALCKKAGEKPADVALAFLLANPVITAPIIGPRTIEQVEGALRAFEIDYTSELRAEIDAIFPALRPSPEGHAW
jgi:aryl-alcohol dehydrogenase-like predicted oxidoreductase